MQATCSRERYWAAITPVFAVERARGECFDKDFVSKDERQGLASPLKDRTLLWYFDSIVMTTTEIKGTGIAALLFWHRR